MTRVGSDATPVMIGASRVVAPSKVVGSTSVGIGRLVGNDTPPVMTGPMRVVASRRELTTPAPSDKIGAILGTVTVGSAVICGTPSSKVVSPPMIDDAALPTPLTTTLTSLATTLMMDWTGVIVGRLDSTDDATSPTLLTMTPASLAMTLISEGTGEMVGRVGIAVMIGTFDRIDDTIPPTSLTMTLASLAMMLINDGTGEMVGMAGSVGSVGMAVMIGMFDSTDDIASPTSLAIALASLATSLMTLGTSEIVGTLGIVATSVVSPSTLGRDEIVGITTKDDGIRVSGSPIAEITPVACDRIEDAALPISLAITLASLAMAPGSEVGIGEMAGTSVVSPSSKVEADGSTGNVDGSETAGISVVTPPMTVETDGSTGSVDGKTVSGSMVVGNKLLT